jgi:predicted kinase
MNLKNPFVILLVGPPLSGKTTWINNNFPDTYVISRDEIVMEVFGSRNYNDAFRNVNQKDVDKVLRQRISDAAKSGNNVIVDMTNISPKRRRSTLSNFSKDYNKVAVVFPTLSDDDYLFRNNQRIINENKSISLSIIKDMISNYVPPSLEEGFNEIISL